MTVKLYAEDNFEGIDNFPLRYNVYDFQLVFCSNSLPKTYYI